MFSRRLSNAIFITVIILLLGGHLHAADGDEIQGVKGTNFGSASTQSISAVSSDPSQSGINDESVNMYTGQHMESFVLASLSGRGGASASLVLTYNGNVTRMAKQENHLVQASPFGLGFTADQESITCDPKGTAYLGDDDYQLVAGGSSMKLHHVEDNRYITEKGHPWQIYRHTAVVGGIEVIIGWTIKREDGTVYRYGDFSTDFTSFNATANTFRYGGRVGNGVLDDDEPYPVAWHLHVVYDPDSLNWVEYNYMQERESLRFASASDTSLHRYTRAIYLDEICLTDGGRIDIDYEPRIDYQPFYGLNFFEYYSTYRADKVITINFAGDTLSIVDLNYGYLTHSDMPFWKLLLTEIVSHSGKDPGMSLPPTRFEYFTDAADPAYGAIKKITYPAGGMKEMCYSVLDEAENLSQLDLVVDSNYLDCRQFVSQNLVISVEDVYGDGVVAFWDGFWHKTTLPSLWLSHYDVPGVTPNNWAVVFDRNSEDLVTLRFNNGCLERDTLHDMEQFTNPDYFDSADNVHIYAGEDCFIVITGQTDGGYDLTTIHSAFYYRWDGSDWTGHKIMQHTGFTFFTSAKVSGDMMCVSTTRIEPFMHFIPEMFAAKYDHEGDSLVVTIVPGGLSKYVLGSNYVAYLTSENVYVCSYDGVSWTSTRMTLNDAYDNHNIGVRHMRVIAKFHNSDGFVLTYDNDDGGHWAYITAVFPTADGWVTRPKLLIEDNGYFRIDDLGAGSHFAVGQRADYDGDGTESVWRFCWDGYRLGSVSVDYVAGTGSSPETHRDSYYWGHKGQLANLDGSEARAWQYMGNQDWSPCLLNTPNIKRYLYSSSENFLVANVGTEFWSANHVYMYAPFYYGIGSNYRSYPSLQSANYDELVGYFFAAGDGFCVEHHFANEDYIATAYKVIDTLFRGKPQIVVVDSVTLSTYASDPDPRVIQYSFYQGMLDQTGVTPRFCKAEKSTPYLTSETEPDGWQVSYFFNDLTVWGDDGFDIADGHVDDSVETPPLSPWDTMRFPYGRENGGYWLDGMPFLEYQYSTDSGQTEIINRHSIFYRLMKTPDSAAVNDIFRVVVHRDTTMTKAAGVLKDESIMTMGAYYYNEYNGMLSEKHTREFGPSYLMRTTCDFVRYAYEDTEDPAMASAMLADNAIAQTLRSLEYVEETGQPIDYTGYSGQRYTRIGGWQVAEKFTSRDFSNPSDTLYQLRNSQFDQFGNLLGAKGPDGVFNCVKYDASGSLVVAQASNCFPEALVVQDFEQGTDWDGWTNFNLGAYQSLETDAFTGEYSYKIADDPGEMADTRGPCREVPTGQIGAYDLYFSAWVKGNHTVRISGTFFYAGGAEGPTRILEFSDLSDSEWQKVDGVLDWTGSIPSGIDWANGSLRFQWCLVDEASNPAPAGAFVMMDNIRLHPTYAHIMTTVYDLASGQVSAESGLNNIPNSYEYDEFNRLVATKDFQDQIIGTKEYYFSDSGSGDPNYTKSTAFFTGEDGLESTVTISFYDGLSNLLQTRRSGYVFDSFGEKRAVALVSGISDRDGRGRVKRQYKPYYDLIAPNGVEDFSDESDYQAEINLYYNGVNAADCGGVPFSETKFYDGVRNLLKEQSGPGVDWQMGSGHTTTYEYDTDPANYLRKTTTVDPDGNRKVHLSDLWNLDEYDSLYYTDASGNPTVVTNVTYNSVKGETDSVAIGDGGADPAVLRRYWYNDLGLTDSTWRVDYGTIRMSYDPAGRLRYMQNDKRAADSATVYYKYDKYGNVIAEGLWEWATPWDDIITQMFADNPDFPDDSWQDVERKYCWAYDYQPATDQYHFGQLIFTANSDSSYYKSYFYKPFEETDSTVVKLKIGGGELKSIVHKYDPISGRIIEIEVYPYQSFTGARALEYVYDVTGLTSVQESGLGDIQILRGRNFEQTVYNAEGQPVRRSVGIYEDTRFIPEIHDTVQVVNYYYNSLGLLTGINHPDFVVAKSNGIGGANPHFGMLLDYTAGGTGYYNGRVAAMKAANSTAYNNVLKSQDYRYSYNELGWLGEAEEQAAPEYYRGYYYNYLGNRDSVMTGSTVTRYDYDPTVGSSKLIGFDGIVDRSYDILGNLVSDGARDVYQLDYDYRNLMSKALVRGVVVTGDAESVFFEYDQTGQRIYKRYHWAYKELCEDPHPHRPVRDFETSTTGKYREGQIDATMLDARPGEYCVYWDDTEDHYLYDGGTLLMTFDENDEVRQFYLNGAGGRVAVYPDNDVSRLCYILSDQVGSARVLVDDDGEVQQWNTYHPFGGLQQTWASYDDRMKFSGKERDQHSTFDYYYFGARYLDTRVGMFTSIDKAGQFAGGYLYGGNNPILGVDPDGNFFLTPFLIAAAYGAAWSGGTYSAIALAQGNWNWNDFASSLVTGAVSGAASSVAAAVAGKVGSVIGPGTGLKSVVVGSGISNATYAMATGSGPLETLQYGLSGMATGLVGGSGGFGLARLGMPGRLGYQALTTMTRSVGDNLASGSSTPFDNMMIGLGPVNFRIRDGKVGVNVEDNLYTLRRNLTPLFNYVRPGGDITGVKWDWESLTPVWTTDLPDGVTAAVDGSIFVDQAYKSYFGTDLENIRSEEGTHLWMERAMGHALSAAAYQYCRSAAMRVTYLPSHYNYFEHVARYDAFF